MDFKFSVVFFEVIWLNFLNRKSGKKKKKRVREIGRERNFRIEVVLERRVGF